MVSFILASKSKARQAMLKNIGYDFEVIPADIDEATIQKEGGQPSVISQKLADEKALVISQDYPDHYIIGSDQVLSMNGKIYSKAKDKEQAIERLKEFSGKTHYLNSAVTVVKKGEILFQKTDQAILTMRTLGEKRLLQYADKAGETLTQSVGCYAIEGPGLALFDKIEGDFFTIMGMPLLPLINFFEKKGITV